jgi:hypothetical protein
MDDTYNDGYAAGVQGAWKAIANEVPRWMDLGGRPLGQYIDPGTGLPIVGVSGPPQLAAFNDGLMRGHNEAISAAIRAGEITVDFRPLLMSRRALGESCLGTLSVDHPRLASPDALTADSR